MTAIGFASLLVDGMPDEVKALGGPWASIANRVSGLTEDLEKDFRFGQSVIRLAGTYRMGGNVKGGTSTMWYPSNRLEYRAYDRWRRLEGIPRKKDRRAFKALLSLCERWRIGIRAANGATGAEVGRAVPHLGYVFRAAEKVLSQLPPSHLERPELAGVQFGGWGPDAAKGSAYDKNWVLLYDFALEGARRTFLGLLLHELGHAQEHAFGEEERARLSSAYSVLAEHSAFLGVEFLLDAKTRQILQLFAFNEFLAETYMIYVSQGGRLRGYVNSLDGPVGTAWRTVYEVFRDAFCGLEYV
ncbi:MAG: hypothetical protein HY720_22440 [Planctomycetes bacterium]|nr:hypothetical protein [Planctomycetota bacterium]